MRAGASLTGLRPWNRYTRCGRVPSRRGAVRLTLNEFDPQVGDHDHSLTTHAAHRFLVGLGNDEIAFQMPAAKFNPSCFRCFDSNVFGSHAGQCPQATNDCGTVFQNNIGPRADGLLQPTMTGLLGALIP